MMPHAALSSASTASVRDLERSKSSRCRWICSYVRSISTKSFSISALNSATFSVNSGTAKSPMVSTSDIAYIGYSQYFNDDTGAGIGASHQTGWTALVAKLLQQSGE